MSKKGTTTYRRSVTAFFSSLRFRLLVLVLLALAPALGLILYDASEQRQRASGEVRANAMRLARLAAAQHESYIEAARTLLIALARLPEVKSGDATACSAVFADLLQQYPNYTNLAVATPNGNQFCNAHPQAGVVNIANRSHFIRALQSRDFAVSEYHIGGLSGKAMINFGYPILDESGQLNGVANLGLDLAWLNKFVADAQLPSGGTLRVIDQNGIIFARYPEPEKWVGHPVPEVGLVNTILSQKEGVTSGPDADGVARLYAFVPLRAGAGIGGYLSIDVPEAVAFGEADSMLARDLIALGFVSILALVAAWGIANLSVVRPVNALLGMTQRLADGDLRARTRVRYSIGELGQLSRSFDRMAETLEQREVELRQAYERAEAEARARAELFQQAISAQEAERLRIARELHDETSQCLSTLILGLDRASRDLAGSGHKVSQNLETTKRLAGGMLDDIHRLIEDLRPLDLDLLGLVPAIQWYGEQRLGPLGITVNLDTDGVEDRLPASVETVLFRIVQEGVTNIIRHAKASVVDIRLAREDGHLVLRVADNGQGFDPAAQSKRFGLRGMQERVRIAGGELQVHSQPGHGTVIQVHIPLPREEVYE